MRLNLELQLFVAIMTSLASAGLIVGVYFLLGLIQRQSQYPFMEDGLRHFQEMLDMLLSLIISTSIIAAVGTVILFLSVRTD